MKCFPLVNKPVTESRHLVSVWRLGRERRFCEFRSRRPQVFVRSLSSQDFKCCVDMAWCKLPQVNLFTVCRTFGKRKLKKVLKMRQVWENYRWKVLMIFFWWNSRKSLAKQTHGSRFVSRSRIFKPRSQFFSFFDKISVSRHRHRALNFMLQTSKTPKVRWSSCCWWGACCC